ncbi:hypothetical protein Prede_2361 [Prevotella dentalis DSM 3688]|uniref:Uncharacterized protein n=1 Tax=Prevotella dentalis (strain ATCC 49559 / DSM 3688 / JCM 13448 / NCTC 12043 / ES 2772) TaxID=908937 RepID=L0JDK9_PREDD|nr:hypothetical protein Prede_2361 [Prevotella dentalis DSM 3688]
MKYYMNFNDDVVVRVDDDGKRYVKNTGISKYDEEKII